MDLILKPELFYRAKYELEVLHSGLTFNLPPSCLLCLKTPNKKGYIKHFREGRKCPFSQCVCCCSGKNPSFSNGQNPSDTQWNFKANANI